MHCNGMTVPVRSSGVTAKPRRDGSASRIRDRRSASPASTCGGSGHPARHRTNCTGVPQANAYHRRVGPTSFFHAVFPRKLVQGPTDFLPGDGTAAFRSGGWNDIAPVFRCPLPQFGILTRPDQLGQFSLRCRGQEASADRADGTQSRRLARGFFGFSQSQAMDYVRQPKMLRGLHLRLGPLWPSFTGRPGRCQWR